VDDIFTSILQDISLGEPSVTAASEPSSVPPPVESITSTPPLKKRGDSHVKKPAVLRPKVEEPTAALSTSPVVTDSGKAQGETLLWKDTVSSSSAEEADSSLKVTAGVDKILESSMKTLQKRVGAAGGKGVRAKTKGAKRLKSSKSVSSLNSFVEKIAQYKLLVFLILAVLVHLSIVPGLGLQQIFDVNR
jgi:hypothetical protein